jgi:hypothetical protein
MACSTVTTDVPSRDDDKNETMLKSSDRNESCQGAV